MSNKVNTVFFAVLLLFVLSREVIGEPPRQPGRPTIPEPIPGISRMNPYYLGISGAVLAQDTKALSEYVSDLEKVASSHPETWLDAMCARLYVLEKLGDRDRFSQAMAQLCAHKLPDERSAKRRLKFVTTTLLALGRNRKTEWVKHTSDVILPAFGPEPDPLLVHILQDRLGHMPHYPERAKLLADALKKASKSLQETPNDHPLRAYWISGLEELSYLSIRNHFSAVKIDPLISETAAYLDKFGKEGRHAAQIFYLLLKALNIYYTQLAVAAPALSEGPSPDWLQRWQRIFTARKAGTWTAKITEEWDKWEKGERARQELIRQPRKNPKLQVRLSLNLTNPKVKDLLNHLNTATELHFTVAENIPEDRIVCGSLALHEVQAWSLMGQLKEAVVSEGRWKTESGGYQLMGNLKPPPIVDTSVSPPVYPRRSPSPRRLWLSAITLASLVMLVFLILLRQRTARSNR